MDATARSVFHKSDFAHFCPPKLETDSACQEYPCPYSFVYYFLGSGACWQSSESILQWLHRYKLMSCSSPVPKAAPSQPSCKGAPALSGLEVNGSYILMPF